MVIAHGGPVPRQHRAQHRARDRCRPGATERVPAARVLRFHPGPAAGRAARVRLLGLAVLRHLPLRLGAAAPLEDGAAGLDLHRGALRGGQAALRPLPGQLRLARGPGRATPTSARRCCSSSGSTTRRSSSCSAGSSPRPGSCARCSGASAPSWAERSQARISTGRVPTIRVPPRSRYIPRVPQVRRAPAREPRQDLAGSSAKRCPVSLRGA